MTAQFLIDRGDGTLAYRLRHGNCPKCRKALPDPVGDYVQCEPCGLKVEVRQCGECDRGMVREPDGYGCVQWTNCCVCQGKGWNA